MRIHYSNTYIDITPNDDSSRYRAIMGDNTLTLNFDSESFIELPVGAYVDYEGERYTLQKPENFTKNGTRIFEYSLILESAQSALGKYKLRDKVDKQLKFSLTAQPHEHIQLIVDNLNERESGWTVGTCIEAVEKVVSFNHTYLDEALQNVADAFDTEWEISGKTIHLKRVEYNKTTPLALSYGKGNGFRPGVGRSNTDNTNAIEVLFVQGGERNIDRSKYGNRELLLPKSKVLTYEGREYVTSADGLSIKRNDKALSTNTEDSLDCTHVYPKRVGEVTSVNVVDEGNHFYDFVDNTIPESLNYRDCLISGETMTVIFESGMLAGKEFEVDYVHADRRFKIVPQEIDGITMPDATFRPQVGEEYAIFGIQLPDAYIQDDATQTGAAWDMLKEAVKYLYENEDPRFTFTGELDGIWAKTDWLNIGGKIKLGGYVNFSDTQFQAAGVLIRIIGIKDYVNNPHSPELELSNVTVGGSVVSELNKIKENEVVGDENYRQSISFTKRRFRSAQETIEMLTEAVDGFGAGINPLSVQSMSLLVGDESLQYRFVSGKTSPVEVVHNIAFNNSTKVLSADGGWMQHMTVGITELSTREKTYKFWNVDPFNSPALVDAAKPYYFYIKASKTAETAVFVLSETAIKMEAVSGYYHFLVGFLNSEVADERTFAQMYGFSEVLPGRISTSKIHADTVEANEVLAAQIYASGAKIGGVDIDPADIGDNGITGLRLGNLTTFSPTSGKAGVMFGKQNDKYKMFIGNESQNIVFDGGQLLLSGYPMLGSGESVGVGELSQYFEIVNKGQANQYLRVKTSLASTGTLKAWEAGNLDIPSLWDSMPIASATQLGGVKVGSGLKITGGVLSVDGELGGVSSWTDLTDKPTWLNHSTLAAFEGGHGHAWSKITGKPTTFTPAAHEHEISEVTGLQTALNGKSSTSHNHNTTYLGISATAADSSKLGGYAAADYPRKDESASITGLWSFAVTTGTVPFLVPSGKTGRVINLNADLLDGYHASAFATSGHTHTYLNNYVSINKSSAASEALDVNGTIKASHSLSDTPIVLMESSTGRVGIKFSDGTNSTNSFAWSLARGAKRFELHYGEYSGTGTKSAFSKDGWLQIAKGSADPTEALDVSGNIKATSTSFDVIKLNRNHTVNGAGILFSNTSGTLGRFGLDSSTGMWIFANDALNVKFTIKNSNGWTSIGKNSTATEALDVNGNIKASGTLKAYQTSDRNLKQGWKTLTNCTDVINRIPVYSFNYNAIGAELMGLKPNETYDTGVMAQELQIIPELKHVVGTIYDKYLGVKYERMVPYLIGAIKELSKELNDLKQQYGLTGN